MLCESILHVLVEEGALSKAKAIEAIETVSEATREIADIEGHVASALIDAIARSFALKAA